MAKLEINGMDALLEDLGSIADLPDNVVEDILNAEADVIVEEQKKTARELWRGPYETGETAASIKKGKVKVTPYGKSISVYPQGKNKDGNRNAEVAFINEYGKRSGRQKSGRPAIRLANERKGNEAVKAGEKVYHAFLDSKNL